MKDLEDSVFESTTLLIKDEFRTMFKEELADSTLAALIKDEIKHRKIEFLKSKLAALGFSFDELSCMSAFMSKNISEHLGFASGEEGFVLKRRGRKAILTPEEREERRKAYAKRYYQARREKELASKPLEKIASKPYKTTPEQRAYQKKYYANKKSALPIGADNAMKKKRGRPAKNSFPLEAKPSSPSFVVTKLRKASHKKDSTITQ